MVAACFLAADVPWLNLDGRSSWMGVTLPYHCPYALVLSIPAFGATYWLTDMALSEG